MEVGCVGRRGRGGNEWEGEGRCPKMYVAYLESERGQGKGGQKYLGERERSGEGRSDIFGE